MHYFFKPILFTNDGYFLFNIDEEFGYRFPQFSINKKIESVEDIQQFFIDRKDFLDMVGILSVEGYSSEMVISIAEGYEQSYFFKVSMYENPPPIPVGWIWIKDNKIVNIKDIAWWDLQQFQVYYPMPQKN